MVFLNDTFSHKWQSLLKNYEMLLWNELKIIRFKKNPIILSVNINTVSTAVSWHVTYETLTQSICYLKWLGHSFLLNNASFLLSMINHKLRSVDLSPKHSKLFQLNVFTIKQYCLLYTLKTTHKIFINPYRTFSVLICSFSSKQRKRLDSTLKIIKFLTSKLHFCEIKWSFLQPNDRTFSVVWWEFWFCISSQIAKSYTLKKWSKINLN